MKLLTVKTARFTVVVEKCGAPQVHTLWQKPASDQKLQMLVKNNRIMTILRTESGSEFGQVGFCQREGARFLSFPRSLKLFCDQRIVGIKWNMVIP